MGRTELRVDINGLRGLSVALVVAYHLQLRGAGGGFLGVDLFFVISGYLMTRILLGDAQPGAWAAYGRFVAARVRRIVPALAALLVLLLVVGAFALPPFDLESLALQALRAASFSSNHYYLAHSGYADRSADDLWLLHTWSLSVEWQFYLVYPLLLFALRRLPHRRAGLTVLLGLAAVSLAYQIAQRSAALESGFFLFGARAWEMLAGGAVWWFAESSVAKPLARPLSLLGLALILGSVVAFGLLRLRPAGLDVALLAPVLGAALILWSADNGNAVLRWTPLQLLGRWSYSIYLWHWPIVLALRWAPWWPEGQAVSASMAVTLSILAGGASYRWVEQPWLARDPHRTGMATAATAVCVIGLAALLAGTAVATQGSIGRRTVAPDFGDPRAYQASVEALMFPDARCSNYKIPAEAMVVCSIERGAGRRVLVVGDSHAGHLWPWFERHSQVSVDFLQASECPPVPNFERLQPGYRCNDYAARAWDLSRTAAYDTVVVSARFSTVGGAGPPYCHQGEAAGCTIVGGATKAELVRDELRAAIERTLAAGKVVVMLDSAPEAGSRVAKRLARETFWYGQPRLTIERTGFEAANAWIEPLFDALRARPGFHRVSLRDRLCDSDRCRVYDATLRRPVYSDDSHFDPLWIAENANVLLPFVQRAAAARIPG